MYLFMGNMEPHNQIHDCVQVYIINKDLQSSN